MIRTQAFLSVSIAVLSLTAFAHGQDIPAVTGPVTYQGFSLPDALTGGLRVGASASESLRTGYAGSNGTGSNGGNIYTTTLSGDAAYLTTSPSRPFSMTFTGGYLYSAGQPANSSIRSSSTFEDLTISQGFVRRKWSVMLDDSFRYLPEAPVNGFSGLAGVGDVGVVGIGPGGQAILTQFGRRVINGTSGTLTRNITAATSVQGTGSYNFEKFVDRSNGLDSNQISGLGGIIHRVNALTSYGGNYSYTLFRYPTIGDFSFVSQSVQARYVHRFSRTINMDLSGGPLRTSSNFPNAGPTKWTYGTTLGLDYLGEISGMSLKVTRGVRSGSGVVAGAISTDVAAVYDRKIGRQATFAASISYTQNDNTSVQLQSFSARTFLCSVQGSRQISRDFSVFASYSAQKQLVSGTTTNLTAFNGLSQIVSGGITYAPRVINLRHK